MEPVTDESTSNFKLGVVHVNELIVTRYEKTGLIAQIKILNYKQKLIT